MLPRSAEIDRRQFLVGLITVAAAQLCPRVASAEEPRDPGTEAEWLSVLMTMFPHPDLDPALYQPAAAALVAAAADPNVHQLLVDGRAELAANAGGCWPDASPAARTAAVAAIVGTPLFVLLRQTAVFTFYNDAAVWARFGYEGDAFSFGGWERRGVDTVDWLPDPAPAE
jgi:hypothetical protein